MRLGNVTHSLTHLLTYLLTYSLTHRDVNGWEDHYHEKSFIYQCKDRFGVALGESVWEECNLAFDRLPLSAVIDHDIFCIHGGKSSLPLLTHSLTYSLTYALTS